MIRSLILTILIEAVVVIAYSVLRKKSAGALLLPSAVINLFTQPLLWTLLRIFFRHYLAALLTAEIFIWLIESVLMFRFSNGQLNMKGAVGLSFCMNAASFGVGWFLPL